MPSSDLTTRSQWHLCPAYHLKAPHGWLNDPCAPGYDIATATYHLFYQWNPKSCDWGDICWGQFTSQDGVHWVNTGSEPVLQPSQPYDKEGTFTGSLHPTGPKGEKGQLLVVYSSVRHLPIHWSKPYARNSAGLALAISSDGGRSWKKSDLNPILAGEPEDVVVTGFRDPFLAEWPALDEIRGEKSLYGVVSGGILDKGPTAFLYAVAPYELTKWKYIGPLVDFPVRFCRSRKWNGDFGVNWECTNFMTLRNGPDERQFLLIGSEGGLRRGYSIENEDPFGGWCMWMAGTLKLQREGVRMEYDFSGLLDNGCFYAANSYEHPVSKTRIVWGWLKEEDLTLARRESKGWTGYMSLPRELVYLSIPNVVKALVTPLTEITSVNVVDNGRDGTKTLQTLGILPLHNLETLRPSSPKYWSNIKNSNGASATPLTHSTNWELEAVIRVQVSHKRVGFHVQHSSDLSQRTSIYFSPEDEEIVVDRGHSNSEDHIKKNNMKGPFTLFIFHNDGVERMEKLHLRIFGDGDVVEIFANDRFALSAVAYADASKCTGISCFVDGGDTEQVAFESIKIWENLEFIQT